MRKLVLLLFGRFVNRIGRFVFPRRLPVPLEHARQILHDGGITDLYGDFPSQVECWLVKVLRTDKRPLVVDDEKLGMRAQILLFVDPRAGLVHQAPQGERVHQVRLMEAMFAAAENAYANAAVDGS